MHSTVNTDILKYATLEARFGGSFWWADYQGNIWHAINIAGSSGKTVSALQSDLQRMGLRASLWQKTEIPGRLDVMAARKKVLVDPSTGRRVSPGRLRVAAPESKRTYSREDAFGFLVYGDNRVYPATGYICANIYEPQRGFWRASNVDSGGFLARHRDAFADSTPVVPDEYGLVASEFHPAPKWAVPGSVDRKETKRLRDAIQPCLAYLEVCRQLSAGPVDLPNRYRAPFILAEQFGIPVTTTRHIATLAAWLADNRPDLSPEQMRAVAAMAMTVDRLSANHPVEMSSATKTAIREACRSHHTVDYLEIRDADDVK